MERERTMERERVRHRSGAIAAVSTAAAIGALLGACSSPSRPTPPAPAPSTAGSHPAAITAPAPTPWQPAAVSSPAFESHPAFDPWTGDLYFVRSSPAFEGWHILVSRCAGGALGAPAPPAFAGPGLEADPFFTDDGRSLYFISTRANAGAAPADLDIWRIDRDERGTWGRPVRLPAPVNSARAEWFPRPSPDGWLYFGSERPGGSGKSDIWRARAAAGAWTVENLGAPINTPAAEYEALPAPDGRLLVMAEAGYFETRWTGRAWSARSPLPPDVSTGREIGALFSPSGRSLLFARDTRGPLSGELFLWRTGGDEAWPPACPSR